jgi:hypothetical protein
MAIIGAHSLLYTPEAERLREVLKALLPARHHVDAGDGWLIFRLPPGEVGVHPSAPGDTHHQLSFVCDDLEATLAEVRAIPDVEVLGPPQDQGYGVVVMLGLPGGVRVQLYQARHPTAF